MITGWECVTITLPVFPLATILQHSTLEHSKRLTHVMNKMPAALLTVTISRAHIISQHVKFHFT